MADKDLCQAVHSAPFGVKVRRWTLRDDNNHHHHGVVSLKESPLYLEFSWRRTSTSPVHRVGLFCLDLPALLRGGFIRPETVSSPGFDVRLRIIREIDGHFYIQVNQSGPRCLLN